MREKKRLSEILKHDNATVQDSGIEVLKMVKSLSITMIIKFKYDETVVQDIDIIKLPLPRDLSVLF